jgi:excisionase family DNA binding protein
MPRLEGEYLTVKAACELLGISPNTLRNWGNTGKLKEYRHPVNNYRLFERTELERLRERLRHPEPKSKKGKQNKG